MPNWKKVIVSGSDASLNSLNVTAGVTGSFTGSLTGTATTASYVNPLNQNVEITGSATNSLRIKGSGATSATNALYIENSGNTGSLVVRDDARVAIGKTSPNTTLDVNGNVLVTGSLTVLATAGGGITIPIAPPTNYYPTLTIATTTFQGYQTSGNVFTITNTGYTIEFGSNRGYMIFTSAGHHYFQSGGNNTRLFISSSGRIGIDRKSTRLNSSHVSESRMPSSA